MEIDPKEYILYPTREGAEKQKSHLDEMQPEYIYEIEDVGELEPEELDAEMDRLLDHLTESGKELFFDYLKSGYSLEWTENMSIDDKRKAIIETRGIQKGVRRD